MWLTWKFSLCTSESPGPVNVGQCRAVCALDRAEALAPAAIAVKPASAAIRMVRTVWCRVLAASRIVPPGLWLTTVVSEYQIGLAAPPGSPGTFAP